MKKQILLRGLFAAPVGLMINILITLGVSAAIGDGQFHPVAPVLAEQCGGELKAMIVQTSITLLYGAMFGASSVIWEMERWSLLRQTVTHLCVICACTFPVAYGLGWMTRSIGGVLGYFALFLAIYAFIWASIVLSVRSKLKRINRELGNN